MTKGKQYHYTMSGLDWVYLEGGYTIHETPYGTGVAIQDAEGLHEAISMEIVTQPHPIRGQELRFLRSFLDVSQDGMGKIVGLSRVQIARLEGERNKAITSSADRALRLFFGLRAMKKDLADRIIEVLTEIDRQEHEPASFKETDFGWAKAA